jgi:hypothetical protein
MGLCKSWATRLQAKPAASGKLLGAGRVGVAAAIGAAVASGDDRTAAGVASTGGESAGVWTSEQANTRGAQKIKIRRTSIPSSGD